MADSTTALATLHPPFATKAELIDYIAQECSNAPNLTDVLFRLVHTDLNGTGSMTGGATVTPTSYSL